MKKYGKYIINGSPITVDNALADAKQYLAGGGFLIPVDFAEKHSLSSGDVSEWDDDECRNVVVGRTSQVTVMCKFAQGGITTSLNRALWEREEKARACMPRVEQAELLRDIDRWADDKALGLDVVSVTDEEVKLVSQGDAQSLVAFAEKHINGWIKIVGLRAQGKFGTYRNAKGKIVNAGVPVDLVALKVGEFKFEDRNGEEQVFVWLDVHCRFAPHRISFVDETAEPEEDIPFEAAADAEAEPAETAESII